MGDYHDRKEHVWARLEEAAAAYFGSANVSGRVPSREDRRLRERTARAEGLRGLQNTAAFQAAERTFIDFKNSPDLLEVWQFVLERSQTPFVQFNTASALCDAVPREFLLHDRSLFVKLRTDILHYVFHRPNLERYVRQQLLRVIAVTTKRGWLANDGTIDPHMAVEGLLLPLFGSEDEHAQNAGFLLGSALLDEFSVSSKSSAVGLSWEYHQQCKRGFEESILPQLLRNALKTLSAVLPALRTSNALQNTALLGTSQNIVELLERVLCWEWSPESTGRTVALAGTFGSHDRAFSETTGAAADPVQAVSVVFPATWGSLLVNKDVVSFIFEAYEVVWQSLLSSSAPAAGIISCLRQCLLQLASLSGPVFDSEEMRVAYMRWFIHGLSRLQQPGQAPPHLHFVAHMIRKRLAVTSAKTITALPQEELFHFLSGLGNVGVECLQRSVAFDPDASEDDTEIQLLEEGVDEVFGGLGRLVDDIPSPSSVGVPGFAPSPFAGFVSQMAVHIVEAYLDSRIELAKTSVFVHDKENEGECGKDRDTYADQLQWIGQFSRLDPSKIFGRLLQAVTECTARMQAVLSGGAHPDGCYGLKSDQYLPFLHEYSHWIVLVCGFVLTDTNGNESETSLVPNSLMNWSINNCAVPQDVIVELGRAVLGFLDVVTVDPQTPAASYCSPLVAEALYWFLGRWSAAYLLPDENLYSQMSTSFGEAFGKASSGGGGTRIIQFILESIRRTFVQWVAEPSVLEEAVMVIEVLARNPRAKGEALQNKKFPELVEFFLRGLGQFPEIIHRPLVRAITVFASGTSEEAGHDHYFDMITLLIEQRFKAAVGGQDFDRVFQKAEVSMQVVDVIEMFDGLIQATGTGTIRRTFDFCSKYFQHLIHVYHVYKLAPDVAIPVFRLFESMARILDLDALPRHAGIAYLNALLALFNEYHALVAGQKSAGSGEEIYASVLAVLNLLTNLMASEFQGYDQVRLPHGDAPIEVAGIVFFGVSIIIPLIDADIMKLPDICTRYISLITSLVEFHADKLASLPAHLLESLIATLEFGVNHYGEIAGKSYQAIAPLALFCHNEEKRKGHASVAHLIPQLNKLLQVTLTCLLYKDFEGELVDSVGEALFALIYCCRAGYRETTSRIVSSNPSPEIQSRLGKAFALLDVAVPPDLPEVLTLRQLQDFRKVLFRVLMDVRGVLRVR